MYTPILVHLSEYVYELSFILVRPLKFNNSILFITTFMNFSLKTSDSKWYLIKYNCYNLLNELSH